MGAALWFNKTEKRDVFCENDLALLGRIKFHCLKSDQVEEELYFTFAFSDFV